MGRIRRNVVVTLVIASACYSALGAAAPPVAPPGQQKKTPGTLVICVDVDGGIVADSSTSPPLLYGETATTRWTSTFDLVSESGNSTVSIPSGSCVSAGNFATTGKAQLAITQIAPRADAGMTLSGIDTVPTKALVAFDLSSRSADIKVRSGDNVLTFSTRAVCTSNWSNSGSGGFGQYGGYCQDVAGGIAEVNVLSCVNCTLAVESFSPGTTAFIQYVVTRSALGAGSYRLEAVSVDGTRAELYMEF